eukprot:5196651-Karenia_brevis.AAC.1
MPKYEVSAEDVDHMKSRVDVFFCRAKLRKLETTSACPHCMCQWICEATAAFDARSALRPALPVSGQEQHSASAKEMLAEGLPDLVMTARLPESAMEILNKDLIILRATSISELTLADWGCCPAFVSLKALEQRRLLNAVSGMLQQ